MRVPTRKVTNAEGREVVINVEDYDPKVHLAVAGGDPRGQPNELTHRIRDNEPNAAKVEVAPADGSEFNFDIPEDDEVKGQDLSAVIPGPELPKE